MEPPCSPCSGMPVLDVKMLGRPDDLVDELEDLRRKNARLQTENRSLRAKNAELSKATRTLRSEKDALATAVTGANERWARAAAELRAQCVQLKRAVQEQKREQMMRAAAPLRSRESSRWSRPKEGCPRSDAPRRSALNISRQLATKMMADEREKAEAAAREAVAAAELQSHVEDLVNVKVELAEMDLRRVQKDARAAAGAPGDDALPAETPEPAARGAWSPWRRRRAGSRTK